MAEARKIGIDDIVEAAAAGVLRALDARGSSSKTVAMPELMKSGFNVDIVIRAGGFPGPLPEILNAGKLAQ